MSSGMLLEEKLNIITLMTSTSQSYTQGCSMLLLVHPAALEPLKYLTSNSQTLLMLGMLRLLRVRKRVVMKHQLKR